MMIEIKEKNRNEVNNRFHASFAFSKYLSKDVYNSSSICEVLHETVNQNRGCAKELLGIRWLASSEAAGSAQREALKGTRRNSTSAILRLPNGFEFSDY